MDHYRLREEKSHTLHDWPGKKARNKRPRGGVDVSTADARTNDRGRV